MDEARLHQTLVMGGRGVVSGGQVRRVGTLPALRSTAGAIGVRCAFLAGESEVADTEQ
jgi:hypothetical protein